MRFAFAILALSTFGFTNRALALTNSNPNARTVWEFTAEYTGNDKAARLMNSFAVGDIGGCCGTMISPHIFMTAAHCGGPDHPLKSIRFFRFNEDAGKAVQNQTFSQSYRGRSFPWQLFYNSRLIASMPTSPGGDTMLWWLDDGADGVPPGVKYGYVGLSPEVPQTNDGGYSFWVNSLTDLGISSTLFYSVGQLTGRGSDDFIGFSIFAAQGASGSSVLGLGGHGHGAIGVTALASAGDGANSRTCADVSFFLQAADAPPNQVLDAIEYDLLSASSAPRDFYRLRFDTPLQRAQWRPAPGAGTNTIVATPGLWAGQVAGRNVAARADSLWHSVARFAPGATYRLSILVNGISTDSSPAYVKFLSDSSGAAEFFEFQPVVGAFQRFNGSVKLGPYNDYRLLLGEGNLGSHYVESISILREDGSAALDFETDEERRGWEYVNGSYPTSWGMNGSDDFSGMVVGPSTGGWSLRNRYTGLEAHQTYQITFDAQHVSGSLSTTQAMIVQNLSGAIESEFTWKFTQAGQRLTHTVLVPIGPETGNGVTFASRSSSTYMVDNIRIQNVPRGNLLGPHLYVSTAYSPFDLSSGMYLEDFEDNALNTPGVSVSAGTSISTGGFTDSVDADDGLIDGLGRNGHSLFSANGATGITFSFRAPPLLSFPTQVGIVWTDGSGTTCFEAFDAAGRSLGIIGPIGLADNSFAGTTDEDRFFGVVYHGGISAIRINNSSGGIEVDHLQYGGFTACRRGVTSDRIGLAGTTPAMAYDGQMDTSFKSSYNEWQHLQIDLGCEGNLLGLRRYMSRDGTSITGNRSAQGEMITYSTDGVTWTSVLGNTSRGWDIYNNYVPTAWNSVGYGWSAWLYLNTPARARYVRFQWDGNSDALHEVQIAFDVAGVAPEFQEVGMTPVGDFQMTMSASIDETYVIEASTNLTAWDPIMTNRAVNRWIDFIDRDTRRFPQRFYRGQPALTR